jgi:hypothetical protein
MRSFVILVVYCGSTIAAEPTAQQIEFFEAKVRPLLVEHCYSCHSSKKQEASLRVDSRGALLKGGDSGTVVVPGEPEKSKLIKAIGYTGKLQMPPDGKLAAPAVETLTTWVKMGLPYPETKQLEPDSATLAKKHWAFQPVRDPALPKVKNEAVVQSPLDRFTEAKLEEKGLALSSVTDKRTLIRRATFDLTGLPPTAEEIDAFVNDNSGTAFEKVVDRLLASPHYGEAQARHWLDLARYSDTKGYVFQEAREYPYAYTYRDWVVAALNADMPYDRFIQLQLAADRVVQGADKHDLAAMGFLTVGRRFLNSQPDIIDDRIDVMCRTFMGLTVTCARCHDHKFDPVPTKDYYSLYGVFASSEEPKELPTIEAKKTKEMLAFEEEVKAKEQEVQTFIAQAKEEILGKLRKEDAITAYFVVIRDTLGMPMNKANIIVNERKLNTLFYQRWKGFLEDRAKNYDPVFGIYQALAALSDKEFAEKAPAVLKEIVEKRDAKKRVNAKIAAGFANLKLTMFKDVAAVYGKVLGNHVPPKDGAKIIDEEELTQILSSRGPVGIEDRQIERILPIPDKLKLERMRKAIEKMKATSPAAPARAMVLFDLPKPVEPQVFIRGNQNNRGPTVPRQFPAVLAGPQRKPFADGSGRLEMARMIADPKNPLTPRVMANRIWIVHFGQGLVRTPSDFGLRSDPPTHPELLDWLASRFIQANWSMKQLHKTIMMSRTYQQSSSVSDQLMKDDPENRLLAHMNRRRLYFEPMRDAMLSVAGQLDRTVGGHAVDLFKEPFSHRRTIYGQIDRQNLPGTLRNFDFAGPDAHSPQRFTTTVPQQALFLMNSPFVVEQAKAVLSRAEMRDITDPEKRIEKLYRCVLGRQPTAEEAKLGLGFVKEQSAKGTLGVWEEYAQVLLLSNEFVFVD